MLLDYFALFERLMIAYTTLLSQSRHRQVPEQVLDNVSPKSFDHIRVNLNKPLADQLDYIPKRTDIVS